MRLRDWNKYIYQIPGKEVTMTRYCPKCRSEYQDWAKKCPECGSKLNQKKPEKASEPVPPVITVGERKYLKEPLVVLATYPDDMDAYIAGELLEEQGIKSVVANPNSVFRMDRSSESKSAVFVKESDLEKAKELLAGIEKKLADTSIPETEIPEIDISETSPD